MTKAAIRMKARSWPMIPAIDIKVLLVKCEDALQRVHCGVPFTVNPLGFGSYRTGRNVTVRHPGQGGEGMSLLYGHVRGFSFAVLLQGLLHELLEVENVGGLGIEFALIPHFDGTTLDVSLLVLAMDEGLFFGRGLVQIRHNSAEGQKPLSESSFTGTLWHTQIQTVHQTRVAVLGVVGDNVHSRRLNERIQLCPSTGDEGDLLVDLRSSLGHDFPFG